MPEPTDRHSRQRLVKAPTLTTGSPLSCPDCKRMLHLTQYLRSGQPIVLTCPHCKYVYIFRLHRRRAMTLRETYLMRNINP